VQDKLQPKIDELAAKIDNTADAITKSTKRRSLEKRATLDEIAQAVAGVVTSVVDILGVRPASRFCCGPS